MRHQYTLHKIVQLCFVYQVLEGPMIRTMYPSLQIRRPGVLTIPHAAKGIDESLVAYGMSIRVGSDLLPASGKDKMGSSKLY